MGLRPLACRGCGFEFRRGHGCLSVVIVVCCQVEASTLGWTAPSEKPKRVWFVWVWSRSFVRGGHDPESFRSATVKVLRLYGTHINVIAFCLIVTYYACRRVTTYCYYCYRVSKKFHVHLSDMEWSESHVVCTVLTDTGTVGSDPMGMWHVKCAM
jgi:hypothetical protein